MKVTVGRVPGPVVDLRIAERSVPDTRIGLDSGWTDRVE